jgi:predicted metal-dependent phosphoesterase TrpH
VYSPAKLIELAAVRGLAAVALTDHDTVAGLAEAGEAAKARGIEFVPGIELDARYRSRSVHILGYFVDSTSTALREAISTAHTRRAERARAILGRLRAIGVNIESAELAASANGRPIGRPHFARALVRSGAARDHDDAFTRYPSACWPTFHGIAGGGGNVVILRRWRCGGLGRTGVAGLCKPAELKRSRAI